MRTKELCSCHSVALDVKSCLRDATVEFKQASLVSERSVRDDLNVEVVRELIVLDLCGHSYILAK